MYRKVPTSRAPLLLRPPLLPVAFWLFASLGGCDTAPPRAHPVVQPEPSEPEPSEPPRPDPGTLENGVPYGTRLRRLTHAEYERTVTDLLGTGTGSSSQFLDDPSFAGFDNNADGLRVAGRLGRDYRRAAEALAREVIGSEDLFDRLVPCDEASVECATDFVTSFGLSAFRRPLRDIEVARYVALFSEGPRLVQSGDALADGVAVVIEAMLQSPNFLYRAELSDEEDDDGFIPLSDYEVASRLSYMLTASMPDRELFRAAAAGELRAPEAIRAQAARLAEGDAVQARVLDFHEQWLGLATYRDVTKNSESFPEFSPDLGEDYVEEVRRFVLHVTLDEKRGLASLLSTPHSFVNRRTAPFYGLDPADFTDEFSLVELDANERAGLLTQLGFLSANAYTTDTSPIHRGVFVLRRILCEEIPDPPGDIDLTLPKTTDEIVTTRDQVEAHTAAAVCANCHSMINPIGFAFEGFDAVGAARDSDNGAPLDTAGSVRLSLGNLEFKGALDLIPQLAESEAARSCYARQWLRYAYGRSEVPADDQTLAALGERLADDTYSVRQLLVDLSEPRAFTHRAPTERD